MPIICRVGGPRALMRRDEAGLTISGRNDLPLAEVHFTAVIDSCLIADPRPLVRPSFLNRTFTGMGALS